MWTAQAPTHTSCTIPYVLIKCTSYVKRQRHSGLTQLHEPLRQLKKLFLRNPVEYQSIVMVEAVDLAMCLLDHMRRCLLISNGRERKYKVLRQGVCSLRSQASCQTVNYLNEQSLQNFHCC